MLSSFAHSKRIYELNNVFLLQSLTIKCSRFRYLTCENYRVISGHSEINSAPVVVTRGNVNLRSENLMWTIAYFFW